MNRKKLKSAVDKGQSFGKELMVKHLALKGYSQTETSELLECLFSEMRNQLALGNSVILKEVCTIKPVLKDEEHVSVGGRTFKAKKRLGLKVRISEIFKEDYKNSVDEDKLVQKEMESLKNVFGR
jgi:hypothetical protein